MKQKTHDEFTPQHDYMSEFEGCLSEGHKRLGHAKNEGRGNVLVDEAKPKTAKNKVITRAKD